MFPRTCPLCGAGGRSPCDVCWVSLDPAPVGPVPALIAYEGEGARLITLLKYANRRACVDRLADGMALLVEPGSVDVVTWAPTSARRRRARGFDQAEVLARAVSRRLGLPCRRLLVRTGGDAQTGRTRAERFVAGPQFDANPFVLRWPRRVLVVDDVVTTGATIAAAVSALERAGAWRVLPVAAAATPETLAARPTGTTRR